MCDIPVAIDGAVIRETTLSQLESTAFSFRRVHLEYAIELTGSLSSLSNTYSAALLTGSETFFKLVKGYVLFVHKTIFL